MPYRLATLAYLTLLFAQAQAQTPARPAKAGDVHVYAAQQKTDQLSYEETVTITAVEGDRIKTSHVRSDKPAPMEGLYGKDWSAFKSGTTGLQLNPASRVLSLPLVVGKSWDSGYEATTTTGAKLRIKVDSKVAAEEKISTPAGEFQTFRIDSEGYVNGVSFPGGWAIRQKVWYAPAIDRMVRVEFKELRTSGADNVSELKQFKPAD